MDYQIPRQYVNINQEQFELVLARLNYIKEGNWNNGDVYALKQDKTPFAFRTTKNQIFINEDLKVLTDK